MGLSGAILAVDIGPLTTVAATQRSGRRSPVVFGDSLTLPTPVVDDGARMGLLQALEIVRGDDTVAVAALAEHLQMVADRAGACDELTIVVPPGWGPRHFGRVTRAAAATGLPQPQIVNEAAAIAADCFPDAGQDEAALVCVFGERASHATVLQRDRGGWIRVATQAIAGATGERLDQDLAAGIGASTADADQVVAQMADVRCRLISGQPAAIVVAGRPAPLMLQPAVLIDAMQALRAAAVAATVDTLDAAAVDVQQLHGAVIAGDLAHSLGLAEDLSERLGRPVTAAAGGRLSAVNGALASRASSLPVTETVTTPRFWGLRGAFLVAPILAVIAGAMLQWQIFDIVSYMLGPEIYRLPGDYRTLAVAFDTAGFAVAGWCFVVACLGLARNLAAVLRSHPDAARQHSDRQAGQVYAFAAVVGLALAALQGLLAQAIIGGPSDLAPPYLASSLAGAAVPALVAIVTGLASRWLTAQPPWTDRLHHPIAAVVLAAAGILAANARSTGLPIGGLPTVVTTVLEVAGGGLLGVGIAFTLVTMRAARLILAAVLGLACMIIVGISNLHSAIVIYLIAVALWWIRRGARIAMDNLPPQWWRRFALAADDEEQPG